MSESEIETESGEKLNLFQRGLLWLARVMAVPVGKDGDGVNVAVFSSGSEIDPAWGYLESQIKDAREAWRQNPLARRLIGLITSYCVGDGIRITSTYGPLNTFIKGFWTHRLNNIELELPGWSDELSRSGELFLCLFRNKVDGTIYARAMPSSRIELVVADDNDYRMELAYKQITGPGEDEKWWYSPYSDQAREDPDMPTMLHYAINRPVGALRGESDLASILIWLRRYSGWLEDRVRLNAGARAFLWVVTAPKKLLNDLVEKYRTPPEPGTVIVADSAGEKWTAVTPNLQAADASRDGRAIRWMIVAGGPGTALTDLGEGEDANLATAKAMGEQKRRFLRRRQRYLVHILSDMTLHAYNRRHGLGTRRGRRIVTSDDLVVYAPDISPEDNAELADAAHNMASALMDITGLVGNGSAMRRLVLRLFMKFSGEQLGRTEFEEIMQESEDIEDEKEQAAIDSSVPDESD